LNQRLLKIETLIILIILISISTSWGAVRHTHSKKKQSIGTHKKYIIEDGSVHTVRKGETLYRIARLNGLSVSELKELNGLKNNKLKIGQKLILKPKADQQPEALSQSEKVQSSVQNQVQDQIPVDEGIYYSNVSEVESWITV